MMFQRAARAVVLALAVLCALPAGADYAAGQEAWDAGRPDDALAQWRVAADAGDRRAMLALGRLYAQGLGAPQDYVEAHKWLNLAAARGAAEAVSERDALAAKMTPAQVESAQALARSWQPGGGGGAVPARAPAQVAEAEAPPPRAIREAQALLAGLGYAPGPADGVWGGRTARAYRSFLDAAGLPAAERLTPEALRAMRAMAKRAGAEAVAAAPAAQPAAAPAAAPPDALHRAAQAGDLAGLQAALSAGGDVDALDGRGRTALMYAANKGYTLLVEPLLEAGADPDVRAPDGATALFMAAAHGHTEIIERLMEAGAEVSVKGPKGKTAVDAARARYGDAVAAKENNEPPAVLVLLEGRTMADVEEDRRLARKYPAGTKLRDCDECPELVVAPAGSYQMGLSNSEMDENEDDNSSWVRSSRPVHEVTIARPFAVGVHEVTVGEFARFVSATGRSMGNACWTYEGGEWKERSGRHWRSPGFRQTDSHPVVCVNWSDAKAYVRWLSGETGEDYRLLSDAEWEYVARAGTTGRYHFGSSLSPSQANYGMNREGPAPVGSYPANAFGLHDVHGNVWEWVEDCWNDSYNGAPSNGSAWESGECVERVLRGGSWFLIPRYLRSAYRYRNTTGFRYLSAGFRVARTLTP